MDMQALSSLTRASLEPDHSRRFLSSLLAFLFTSSEQLMRVPQGLHSVSGKPCLVPRNFIGSSLARNLWRVIFTYCLKLRSPAVSAIANLEMPPETNSRG